MIRPTVDLAIAINREVREADEWFDEPDDLERLEVALESVGGIEDPIEAAAVVAYRVTRTQAFGEGNKRTALLLARWTLDRNGLDGSAVLPPADSDVGPLLVRAASGNDVHEELIALFRRRSRG